MECKYPDRPVPEEAIKLTVPLEIIYWIFDEDGTVIRSGEMELNEVATLLRRRKNDEQNDLPNPGSSATVLLHFEDLRFEQTGEFGGVVYLGERRTMDSKFYISVLC